jgi:amidase
MNPDFDSASASTLAAAVAARQVSALELCDAAIRRIERLDGTINAVVVRDFERAREQARACDRAVAQGQTHLPLLGVPMTVKESFDVAGLPTTWGLMPFRDFRPAADAVLVARLKAAGAVILGKTNLPPSLADWQSDNPIYGRTANPHDLARTPGGSSGGAAAAVAAGMVALELGSDIGGSVRIPAHFCGVFAHKPSFGLLPLRGHNFPGTDGAPTEMAVAGPLARSAGDLALALEVLAGPDADDATAYRLALPPPRHATLAGCRVLKLGEHPCALADAATRGALDALCAQLAAAGAHVEHRSALLPDLAAAHKTYLTILSTVTTRGAPGARAVISAHEWFNLLDRRLQLCRQWRALFQTFDVVLMPAFGTPAFEHTDEPSWPQRTLPIDGAASRFGDQLAWSGIATLAGLPATVVPVAKTAGGLPIGLQIAGPYLEDRTTIAVAGQIAKLTQT